MFRHNLDIHLLRRARGAARRRLLPPPPTVSDVGYARTRTTIPEAKSKIKKKPKPRISETTAHKSSCAVGLERREEGRRVWRGLVSARKSFGEITRDGTRGLEQPGENGRAHSGHDVCVRLGAMHRLDETSYGTRRWEAKDTSASRRAPSASSSSERSPKVKRTTRRTNGCFKELKQRR